MSQINRQTENCTIAEDICSRLHVFPIITLFSLKLIKNTFMKYKLALEKNKKVKSKWTAFFLSI